MFKLSRWKPWEILAFGTLAVAGLTVIVKIVAAPEGEEDWAAFKEKHHCVSVAQEQGGNGAGWRCDDGQIHYRWRQQK